ncbi:MAG TPA: amidohydrolase [Bacteroidales bacterium]|nr:amidohydrolase [Bacteroidales bacterium]
MKKESVDLLIKDARIYTVDEDFTIVDALVIDKGKIVDRGSTRAMERKYEARNVIALPDHFVYPGWNDAHCHFTGYGLSLNEVNLTGTESVEEILGKCNDFVSDNNPDWITGRGWDQNDWDNKSFPHKSMLDQFFPDLPVMLKRVDGHAAWVNSKALEIAEIDASTVVEGGDVMVEDGEPTGILIDNAIDLVAEHIPEPGTSEIASGLLKAQDNCFAVGLTSVSDAGLATSTVKLIEALQRSGDLKMRINAWLEPSEENFETYIDHGVLQNELLTINTLKLYADGALGSRGAKMIEPYADDPQNSGLYLTDPEELKEYCKRALENNYQVATHCIGDAANRTMLEIYSDLLEEGNDRRWRIEHAQIIHPDDFSTFKSYQIVPSVQPTHATSDMYWAEDRIGKERMEGAYSYKTLLDQLGWIPNGSDFPVEDINPLYGFFAAVARKDHEGYPENGFRMEEAMSREEALRAMTIWAAKASFEEHFKGSLEVGKLADLVITQEDIMEIDELAIPEVKVTMTISNGELVYANSLQ